MARLAKQKGISRFNEELELAGYKRVNPLDVEATYMSMINLPKKKLEKVRDDKLQPILVKIIAEHLLGNDSFEVLEKVLDRGMGKAVQRSENLNKELVITIKDYEGEEYNGITT